jgi:quercetin dioxygenase-like cupin family protein
MSKNRWVLVALLAIATGALATVVLATPGSGVSSVVQARASFVVPVDLKLKVDNESQDVIHVPDTRETVIQQITIAPGGHTGWHSHPGPAVALIKSGTLTLFDGETPGCAPRAYTAGQSFVDRGQGHVHLAANLGTTNVEVWVTYFDVPPGDSPRIDQADPHAC